VVVVDGDYIAACAGCEVVRIGPLCFHATYFTRQPKLAFVFCGSFRLLVHVSFCCIRFSFFSTKLSNWLHRMSLKWPFLCQVGRKTSTMLLRMLVCRMRLCTSVTDFEVERAKNQLKTAILSDITDTSYACRHVARQVLQDLCIQTSRVLCIWCETHAFRVRLWCCWLKILRIWDHSYFLELNLVQKLM